MKKIFVLVLAVLLIAGSAFALEGSRVGSIALQSKTITNNPAEDYGHAHVSTSPCYVYRVTFSSSLANTYVQLIDSNSTGGANSTAAHLQNCAADAAGGNQRVKADVGGATANEGKNFEFDPPLKFEYGILAGFTTSSSGQNDLTEATIASATVHYRQD